MRWKVSVKVDASGQEMIVDQIKGEWDSKQDKQKASSSTNARNQALENGQIDNLPQQ